MADSIPSLRRKLAEAQAEISRLQQMQPEEKTVYVKGDTKIVEIPVEVEKTVCKTVEVPVEVTRVSYETVYVDREVYVDNPEHLRTIEVLQEKLAEWQNISQSDS